MTRTLESHAGKELQMMLNGKKPMAAFYRTVGERFDETDDQPFDKHVSSGRISKKRFLIANEGQAFRLTYSTYAMPGEEWRAELYKAVKKIGQTVWCKDLQEIEGILLGYGRPGED